MQGQTSVPASGVINTLHGQHSKQGQGRVAAGQLFTAPRALGSPAVSDHAEDELLLLSGAGTLPVGSDDQFGQMTAVQRHTSSHQRGAGNMLQTSSVPARADYGASAPAPLPPPAFELMRQQPAGHGGHTEQGVVFRPQDQHQEPSASAHCLPARQQQQPEGGPQAGINNPAWGQPPQHPSAAASGPRVDRTSELAQLLASLSDEELQAVVMRSKVLKSESGPLDDSQRQQQQGGACPSQQPAPFQPQHSATLQGSQQPLVPAHQGLVGTVSAPAAVAQQVPALPATLSAPPGTPPWHDRQQPASSQDPRQPPLALPRFIPEAEYQGSNQLPHWQQMLQRQQQQQPAASMSQQQQQQQQQPHTSLGMQPGAAAVAAQRPAPPQQQHLVASMAMQPAAAGVQQQQQQPPWQQSAVDVRPGAAAVRDNRPPQVTIPPALLQPSSQGGAAPDLLAVMQALAAASQLNNAPQQQQQQIAAAAAAAESAHQLAQPQHGGNALLEAAIQGIASAVLQGTGPTGAAPYVSSSGAAGEIMGTDSNLYGALPPAAAVAAAPAPAAAPAASAGMPFAIWSILQQLLAKQDPSTAEAAGAPPAPPAALPHMQLPAPAAQVTPPGLEGLLALVASVTANVGPGGRSPTPSPGNKRLMAAAKDLLAALQGGGDAQQPAAAASALLPPAAAGRQQEDFIDPAAAAAAPRDVPFPPRHQQRGSSVQAGAWQASGYGGSGYGGGLYGDEEEPEEGAGRLAGKRARGRYSSYGGARADAGSTYDAGAAHPTGPRAKQGRGRPPRHTKSTTRGSTPSARPAAASAGVGDADGSKSSLFALLAALEEQEELADEGSDEPAAYAHEPDDDASYDAAAAAAAPWDGAWSEHDVGETELTQQVKLPGLMSSGHHHGNDDEDQAENDDEVVVGHHTYQPDRSHNHNHQPHRRQGLAARQIAARAAPAAARAKPPVVSEALAQQGWLLKRRPGGKRPVKPNEAFVSFTTPVLPLLPPRPKPVRPAREAPPEFDPNDRAAVAAQPVEFIDGPHLARPHIKRPRTSWGWYLLGKGNLQQQGGQRGLDMDVEEAGAGLLQQALQQPELQMAQHSGSSGVQPSAAATAAAAAAAGAADEGVFVGMDDGAAGAGAAAAGAGDGDVEPAFPGDASAGLPAGLEAGGTAGGSDAATAAAAGGGGGGSPSGVLLSCASDSAAPTASTDSKKRRWTATGSTQWVTADGVTVWPKDTLITPEQRVFYVAFKWVQKHWPYRVGHDSHISSVPVEFWVDGQEAGLRLNAKIRLYDKAAHMVVAPYSSLAQRYVGKWLAGYGFDSSKGVVRAYLATEQPILPKPAGNRWVSKGKPAQAAAGVSSSAAAASGVSEVPPASQSGQGQLISSAAATGQGEWAAGPAPAAAAAAGAGGGQDVGEHQLQGIVGQQAAGGVEARSGRRKRKAPWWQTDTDQLMQSDELGDEAAQLHTAATPSAPVLSARTDAEQQQPSGPPAASMLPDGAVLKRVRPSRSAAAGVSAATIAAGGSSAPSLSAADAAAAASADKKQPAETPSMRRSAQGRAAVAKRWARYREAQAQSAARSGGRPTHSTAAGGDTVATTPAAAVPAAAAARSVDQVPQQKPLLVLPELSGQELVADLGVLNTALLCVSEAMKVPEELLCPLSTQLVAALAAAAAGAEGTAAGAATEAGAGGVLGLHAALKAWYDQLCGAVGARNGSMVAQLMEELGSNVLQAAP